MNLCFVAFFAAAGQPRVAVVREEGSNGDREMAVSLFMAGFEVNKHSSPYILLCLCHTCHGRNSSLYLSVCRCGM